MGVDVFNASIADSQATDVMPVSAKDFDLAAYEDYEQALMDQCRRFSAADSGVLVYRRIRVAEVFAAGCRDMRNSLELQLGGLQKSMEYKADVPNFIEPWYGIGIISSAFGIDYAWPDGGAPAIPPIFDSSEEALAFPAMPVKETGIGRHTLKMIDFFLEETGGRLPVSLTDVQSPFNIACHVMGINNILMDMIQNPEGVRALLRHIASLLLAFTHVQTDRIGEALASPGHGFASARCFEGMGMSDDYMLMMSPDMYRELALESVALAGAPFGGPAFHSCGDWSDRMEVVREIGGLCMVDGAFSHATDPSPNSPERFPEVFANTGIVVNARIVGTPEVVCGVVRKLWRPGMKLVITTYCQTPEEQCMAYDEIHRICSA